VILALRWKSNSSRLVRFDHIPPAPSAGGDRFTWAFHLQSYTDGAGAPAEG
jgi:hypothetical protein